MPFKPSAITGALDVSTGDRTCTATIESLGTTAASDRGGLTPRGIHGACTPPWGLVSIDGAERESIHGVVVPDSGAGFVTGGCWIDSPNGACPAAPALTCTRGSMTQ